VHRKTKEEPNFHRLQSESKPNENHMLATYEHAPIGIVECSPKGMHINVNGEFCRITGYEKRGLLTCSIRDISFQDDYKDEAKLYEQLIAGEIISYTLEKRYICKDGEIIWLQVMRSCVRNQVGKALCTVGGVQDITERRQIEAHNKFQARLLENVHDAIFATNDKLRITHWNRAAEELYGWTAAEVLGKPILEITQSELTPEERNSVREQTTKENSSTPEAIHVEAREIARTARLAR